jgi:NitT/TauT family transport system ATP-binding protein
VTSRPGRILEDRALDFPRPRTIEGSYAPAFATLVQQLRMRIAEARSEPADAQRGDPVAAAGSDCPPAVEPERMVA